LSSFSTRDADLGWASGSTVVKPQRRLLTANTVGAHQLASFAPTAITSGKFPIPANQVA
jgi:hypothetical protein